MEFIRVQAPWELACVHYLRVAVGLHLNIPPNGEIDEKPEEILEYGLLMDGDTPVATGRLRIVDGRAKFERITVAVAYQSKGHGRRLMAELEAWAREKGLKQAYLTGKLDVEDFYRKSGYASEGEVMYKGRFPLVTMSKRL